jgi:hypothetical protein
MVGTVVGLGAGGCAVPPLHCQVMPLPKPPNCGCAQSQMTSTSYRQLTSVVQASPEFGAVAGQSALLTMSGVMSGSVAGVVGSGAGTVGTGAVVSGTAVVVGTGDVATGAGVAAGVTTGGVKGAVTGVTGVTGGVGVGAGAGVELTTGPGTTVADCAGAVGLGENEFDGMMEAEPSGSYPVDEPSTFPPQADRAKRHVSKAVRCMTDDRCQEPVEARQRRPAYLPILATEENC